MSDQKRQQHRVTVESPWGDHTHTTVAGPHVRATLALEDGREVQVLLREDGLVSIRAWAASPAATKYVTACEVSFKVPTLEDMILDGKEVSATQVSSFPLFAESLADPNQNNQDHQNDRGPLPPISEAVSDRITSIRTLLALRGESEPTP